MKTTSRLTQSKYQNTTFEKSITNCQNYQTNYAKLSIYKSSTQITSCGLDTSNPVLISTLEGQNIIYIKGHQTPFELSPGHSVLLYTKQISTITLSNTAKCCPSRYLVITINAQLINKTLEFLSEDSVSVSKKDENQIAKNFFIFQNHHFETGIHKIVQTFNESHEAKSALVDLALQSLMVRLLKTDARHLLFKHCMQENQHYHLRAITHHIQQNLDKDISIDDLCQKVHMSKANLFRYFKKEIGVTPVEFINQQRITKAKEVLRSPYKSIKDACYEAGYNSISYFTKVFKKFTGLTPKQYKT